MPLEVTPGMHFNWTSSNFDSELYLGQVGPMRNADLFLDAAVYFRRIEPPSFVTDVTGVRHTVLSWDSESTWNGWVHRCKRIIERRFSNKIWLVAGSDWGVRYTVAGASYRPAVKCGLRVQPVGPGQRRHLLLDCYRVPSSFCPVTPAQAALATIYRSYMQGNYGRIVNVDAWSCYTDPQGHRQEVSAHEVGHFLGLSHVGVGSPGCTAGSTNAQACYGVTVRQLSDLMGWGDRVEAWHGLPWALRLSRHVVLSVPWTVTTVRPRPFETRTGPAPASGHRMDAGPPGGPVDAGLPGGV